MIYKYLCYKMSWHFIVTQDIINLNCFKKKMIKYLIRMINLFLYFQNDKQFSNLSDLYYLTTTIIY